MPNILIYHDQSNHNAALAAVAKGETILTRLLADYQALNLTGSLTTADLPALLAQPAELLLSKYVAGGSFQFNGLPVNPAKVLELLEIPAEHTAFVQAVDEAKQELSFAAEHRRYAPVEYASSYEVSGNRIQFTVAARQKLDTHYKSYATSDKQAAVLKELQTISAALNRLKAFGSPTAVLEKGFVLPLGGDPAEIRPNPSFVQSFNSY